MNRHYAILLLVILLFATTFSTVYYRDKYRQQLTSLCDTTIVTIYDSIPYYYPVAKDSVIKRYITITQSVYDHKDSIPDTIKDDVYLYKDSMSSEKVKVNIPISQKKYQTPDYRIYISGYRTTLDSVFIYKSNTLTTINKNAPTKKWSLGISVGVGATPKGFQPFVGVTISRKLFEF